jgi:glycosyltransferase involved in cell wall biosynthesis
MRNPPNWNVSVIAFGPPSDPRTFSGYAAHLTRALGTGGHLRREYSARLVRPGDALRGAIEVSVLKRPHLRVSRAWMWSKEGCDTLSRRVCEEIRAHEDRGGFLQVGTLVRVDEDLGPHYVLTDMTIRQARQAGQFAVSRMSETQIDEAERTQHACLAQSKRVFTLSRWAADSIVRDYDVPESRVSVVYAGANLVIAPGVREDRVDREILFVGIDWERKGGPLLIDAFREVRRRFPDAALRIVGCSPEVAEPGVQVEGYLDRRDPAQAERLIRCYLRASCFCLPSSFDPFPNAIIEAASVGLPTVAIDNGSRREAIIDGQTGVLAKEGSASALADAICRSIENPDVCRGLGERARKHAQDMFTWERVVARIGAAVNHHPAPEPVA